MQYMHGYLKSSSRNSGAEHVIEVITQNEDVKLGRSHGLNSPGKHGKKEQPRLVESHRFNQGEQKGSKNKKRI
jgi:hypothetical protein